MTTRRRVYLAGPDVFVADPITRGRELKGVVAEFGLEGVFPLDAELSATASEGVELALEIHRQNEALIRSCDAVLANLTPFRGPSADPGTVYEIGYARGLGHLIVGYTETVDRFEERVVDWALERGGAPTRRPDGSLEDPDGNQIEGFGLIDNLMIDGAIRANGGTIIAGGASPMRRAAAELAARLRAEGASARRPDPATIDQDSGQAHNEV